MDVPTATMAGTFEMCGVMLRCYVLEDGTRIIDAEDVVALFAAMESTDEGGITPEQAEEFARFCKGL